LRDHPSVVLWCGNNEVETGWRYWGDRQGFKLSVNGEVRERVWQDYVVLFRDVLKSVVDEYAGVSYWPSSPGSNFDLVAPGKEDGDMHYWMVWHALNPIEDYTLQYPRFMSEFGFQSFPEMKTIRSFATPEEFDIRSTTMQSHQKNKGGNERILTYMLREYHEPKDFESFVYLSQVQQAEAIKVGAEHLRRQRPRTMGSLYWQLNDCWPVASWSSIDYDGNWKALQYYTKRFYDDVLVSPWLHDGKVDVYVVSDKMQPLSGILRIRLLDFSGKVLSEKMKPVQVPALSSAVYSSVSQQELLAAAGPQADPKKSFLVVDLAANGGSVSRNLLFFERTRNLDLPYAPKIQTKLEKHGDGYVLTLQSPTLARDVFVSFGDLQTQLSDNYVDLIPGEVARIQIRSAAGLEELQSNLSLKHLMQAFVQPAQGN
jgi:beta-mannosidase